MKKYLGGTFQVPVMIVAVLTVLVTAVWAAPRTVPSERPRLQHFLGDPVVVSFISAPPDMSRTTKAVLMNAEAAGIVLRFGKEEIFFSFANIISVEPTP